MELEVVEIKDVDVSFSVVPRTGATSTCQASSFICELPLLGGQLWNLTTRIKAAKRKKIQDEENLSVNSDEKGKDAFCTHDCTIMLILG